MSAIFPRLLNKPLFILPDACGFGRYVVMLASSQARISSPGRNRDQLIRASESKHQAFTRARLRNHGRPRRRVRL